TRWRSSDLGTGEVFLGVVTVERDTGRPFVAMAHESEASLVLWIGWVQPLVRYGNSPSAGDSAGAFNGGNRHGLCRDRGNRRHRSATGFGVVRHLGAESERDGGAATGRHARSSADLCEHDDSG